jgi:hypothetical protein
VSRAAQRRELLERLRQAFDIRLDRPILGERRDHGAHRGMGRPRPRAHVFDANQAGALCAREQLDRNYAPFISR